MATLRKRKTTAVEPIVRPTLDVVRLDERTWVRRGALVRVRPEHGSMFTMEVIDIVADDDGEVLWIEGREQGAHAKFRAVRAGRIARTL